MPYEDILESYNSQKKISKNVPSARSEFELTGLSRNKAFLQHQQEAADYMARRNELYRISDLAVKDHHKNSNISRFEVNYLVSETSPETIERNEDFHDMMYAPEGQQWLADHTIGATLGGDLSLGYPESTDEAFELARKNPSVCEQMMTVVKVIEDHPDYTLKPLIAEQLQYNKTAMEGAVIGQSMMKYYGSDLCCAVKPTVGNADMAQITLNVAHAQLPQEENALVLGVFSHMAKYNEVNTGARKETVRQLREEGVIGPESMFYRCYDENKQRIAFDKAVNDRAAGKKVEFVKMSEAEQVEMREAIKHPTVLNKKDPGALYGKDFQNECRRLYEALDNVDKTFIRSSEQFRTIKKSLKEMAGRKTIPNADEAKKFLHDVVKVTSSYIKDRKDVKDKSDYAKSRLEAMTRVHESLSGKLGVLAFNSFKVRTASREANERNQERMAQALDLENVEKGAEQFLSEKENEQPVGVGVSEEKAEQYLDDSMSVDSDDRSYDDFGWLAHEQHDDDGISVDDEQPAEKNVADKQEQQPADENKQPDVEIELDKEKFETGLADFGETIEGVGGTQLDQMADFVDGKLDPIEKADAEPGERMAETDAEDIADVLDELGKPANEYAYDENPEVNLAPDEGVRNAPFLQELTDRKLFDQKVDEYELYGTREKNVRFLYEKAVNARKTLEAKCASGQEKVSAHEMKDIIAYGAVMSGLDKDDYDSLRNFISQKDITKQDPGILVPKSMKAYYDKEHTADVVRTMLNNMDKLEGTCFAARVNIDNRITHIKKNNPSANAYDVRTLHEAEKDLDLQSRAERQQAKQNEEFRKKQYGLGK